MTTGLLILAVLAGLAIVWAFMVATVGRLLGATITHVTIFVGPTVRLGRFGETEIRLAPIPIGSSARFLSAESQQEAPVAGHRRPFEALPLPVRLTLHLIGWVPAVIYALVILGFGAAMRELAEGFRQVFAYLLNRDFAAASIQWLQAAIERGEIGTAIAVLSMKVVAFNLLPLPLLSGGDLLREIASSLSGRALRWPEGFALATLLFYVVVIMVFVQRTWRLLG